MKVRYRRTLDDLVAHSLHSLRRSDSVRSRYFAEWIGVPMTCIALGLLAAGEHLQMLAIWLVGWGVVYAFLHPFLYRYRVARAIRQHYLETGSGADREISLTLTEDTLVEWVDGVESVARWDSMRGVEVVGDRTYIYVTGMLSAIVPRHGFEREEEYEAVRDFALRKLETPQRLDNSIRV